MQIERYLTSTIKADALAKKKMAFISGPRQVGKSTLAQILIQARTNYFLYDDDAFRRRWTQSPLNSISDRTSGPIVFDEIHKDRKWKTKLKGLYDQLGKEIPIIVTGSARLDHYRKGSDSLLGRYLPYRLHPLSVAETKSPPGPDEVFSNTRVNFSWSSLLQLGGFPEPLLGGVEAEAKRWSRLRLDRLIMEDSRDFRNISDLNAFRLLTDLLPERVGSLLSINALHEDVQKAYATVRDWIQILDLLYYSFLIRPYSRSLKRALKSEPKLYLYDILQIQPESKGQRAENLTALHLLKACHFWTDSAQGEFDLRFVRDKEKREVDFLILRDQRPWMLVECKSNSKAPAEHLVHFSALLKPKHCYQLVSDKDFDRYYSANNIRVMSYEKFFSGWV